MGEKLATNANECNSVAGENHHRRVTGGLPTAGVVLFEDPMYADQKSDDANVNLVKSCQPCGTQAMVEVPHAAASASYSSTRIAVRIHPLP